MMRAKSSRPVRCEPIEVLIRADPLVFKRAKVAVLPFEAPDYAPGVGGRAAATYVQELLRRGVFAQPVALAYAAADDEDAIRVARRESFDLVMRSRIVYLLDGSGALPTHLEAHIRILDVRSGKTLWSLNQEAFSEPGPDVDLYWTTFSGSPAQRSEFLSKALAEQLSEYLSSP